MKRTLLFVAFAFCIMLIMIGCSKEQIKKNALKSKDRCQAVSYNAPLTGFKTFYTKRINAVGNAVEIYARIAGVFGDSENYKLKVRYLSHTHARITGFYTLMEHWVDYDVIDEPGGFGDDENIVWDAIFDASTLHLKHLINRNANPGEQDTIMSLFYEHDKLVEVETFWNGRWWFNYDTNGNVVAVGPGPQTEAVMTMQYSNDGIGRRISYQPFDRDILVEFTLADMMGWLPLQSDRQRTSFESNRYPYSFSYTNHTYDANGNLLGWNGETQNTWQCRPSALKP